VFVCGQRATGKTSLLMQLSFGQFNTAYIPTIEDTFTLQVDGDKGSKEILLVTDSAGLQPCDRAINRQYVGVFDAFIIVFSVDNLDSFNCCQAIKQDLDKIAKDSKKEVPIVVLANKIGNSAERRAEMPSPWDLWAQKERVKLFEVSISDRKSLMDPFLHVVSKLFEKQKESKFTLTKRSKDKQPGAAIVMDI